MKTEYDDYSLFSENRNCEWIYFWFNEKMGNELGKLEYEPDIKIEYSVVNEFFHDCLEIVLDPKGFVERNPKKIIPFPVQSYKYLYDVQQSAGRIIDRIIENRHDILGRAEFYFGYDD